MDKICECIFGIGKRPKLLKWTMKKLDVGCYFDPFTAARTQYQLCFSKLPFILENSNNQMLQVSAITLNQAKLSEKQTERSSSISVHLQGSEIVTDSYSIISTVTKFLQKMNENKIQMIEVYQPIEFDVISRRTLFKCLAHAITHYYARVDLTSLKIRIINFCWDIEEIQKFYEWEAGFIEVDNILIEN